MGCGPSKNVSVAPSEAPQVDEGKTVAHSASPKTVRSSGELGGERLKLPAIQQTKKDIAFEIPIGESRHIHKNSLTSADDAFFLPIAPEVLQRPSLPKLSRDSILKLADSDARWKELEENENNKKNKTRPVKRAPPKLTSTRKRDASEIAKDLARKEAQAALNRERELEKVKSKLHKQEERAKRAKERKRIVEKQESSYSNGSLEMSWGGESVQMSLHTQKSEPISVDSAFASRTGSGKNLAK
ncbi:MAG: hypothetical protein SGCHY_003074 [Lobulomycetales sp.]